MYLQSLRSELVIHLRTERLRGLAQVDYVDVWTDHTPYPFNQLPKTYSFMVRNSLMWRIGYYGQQPRFIHVPTQTVSSLFVSKASD